MAPLHTLFTKDSISLLLQDLPTLDKTNPSTVTLEEIIANSNSFSLPFPIDTPRCKTLTQCFPKEILEENANSTYPILHEDILALCASFIISKRKTGTVVEKRFYQNMTVLDLIQKILAKRAATFIKPTDYYTLINGTKGHGNWETIGTPSESPPLTLEDCLSYDELKLSAFLSISSRTCFINDGDRKNDGIPEDNRKRIEDCGVIIGLIGPRLVKYGVMDHADIIFSHKSPSTIPKLIAGLYDVAETEGLMRMRKTTCRKLKQDLFFDNDVYKKRLSYSFDIALGEANRRGKDVGKFAFVHIVGIGLGLWKISGHQEKVFLETFAERIQVLGEELDSISDIRFGYFTSSECGNYGNGQKIPILDHPKKGIKVHFSKDNPNIKLTGEHSGKLLVVTYAWDSNALPGNEFWIGKLHSSGDSAAACSTQITELHNTHINPKCKAENLRIVTQKGNVITYAEKLQELNTLLNK